MIIRETKAMTQTERMESRNSNFLYQNNALNEHISQNKATPHIIDSGKSGIWSYRKWSNGVAECWGRNSYRLLAPSESSNGAVYYSADYTENLPSGLFSSVTSWSVSTNDNWSWTSKAGASTSAVVFRVARGSPWTESDSVSYVYAQFIIKGRWTEESFPEDYDDIPTVDQTYNPESTNAQSGTAVAEAAEQAIDKCGTAIISTSDTGKALAINDSAESYIKGLTGYGESMQDGTPAPDSPVEIVSVENPVISIYGKNLIPYPYEETTKTINGITFTDNGDGTVTANGTATAAAYFLLTSQNQGIETKGLTVTLSGCPVGGSTSSYFLLLSYGGNSYQDIGSGLIRTPTEPVTIQLRVASGATVNNITFKPQLELGSVATFYEPYNEEQTVTIPYTFRGLKNTTTGQWSARDELRVGDGKAEVVRNVKSLVITAENSDSYSFLSGNISGDICRMQSYKNGPTPLFNDMTQDASVNYVLCNLFEHYKSLQAVSGYEGISGTIYTGHIYINISLTRIGLEPDTTVGDAGIRAAFWNWIKDKGCEIDYILAEPAIEDITDTEAGQALLKLYTNYPNTSVVSDIDLTVGYKADTKNYIDNKIVERLSAVEAAILNNI